MAQYLISAPPKSGKTMYVVELIFSILHKNPERRIYTNIIGIDIPGVISVTGTLHKPMDWRDFPNGSVVIYDEAHEHPAFTKDDLLKDIRIDESRFDEREERIEKDLAITATRKKELIAEITKERKLALYRYKEQIVDIARGLTLHGHFGFDIYFLTQDVRRMNDIALAATNDHIILRRLFKLPACIVYKFAEVQRSFTGTSRRNAISIGFYRHKKYLRKFYISGEYHNNTPVMPWGLILMILLLILIFTFAYFRAKQANSFGAFSDKKQDIKTVNQPHNTASQPNSPPAESSPVEQKDLIYDPNSPIQKQLKTQELVKTCVSNDRSLEDCRMLYDEDYSKAHRQQQIDDLNRQQQIVTYDPSKPYDFDNSQVQYQVVNKPVFSGCIKYGKNEYKAYTQQGTLLKVDPSVCKRLIDENDRPFDYFNDRSPKNQPSSNTTHTDSSGGATNNVVTLGNTPTFKN